MSEKQKVVVDAHLSSIMLRSLAAIDLQLSQKLAICRNPNMLRPFMLLLEFSAHGVPWISCTIFALLNAATAGEKEIFLNLFVGLIADLIVVGVLKSIFRRPRPSYNQQDMFLTVSVDHYSFPSGHATRCSMVMVFLLTRFNLRLSWKFITILWSICVSVSRVVLGRHHVSDVIVGFLVGLLQYYWIVSNLWVSWSFFNEHLFNLFGYRL